MIFAGFFAGALCLGLILGDWFYFMRLTPDASRYGCGIARTHDRFTHTTMKQLADRFDAGGFLTVAAWNRSVLPGSEPDRDSPEIPAVRHRLSNIVAVERADFLSPEGDALAVLCRKLTPWSSALLTGLWFVVVVVGYGGGADLLVHRGTTGGSSAEWCWRSGL